MGEGENFLKEVLPLPHKLPSDNYPLKIVSTVTADFADDVRRKSFALVYPAADFASPCDLA